MSVRVTCSKCQAALALPDGSIGKKVQCGKCKQIFVAEAPPVEAPLVAEIVEDPEAPIVAEIEEEPADKKAEPVWDQKGKKKKKSKRQRKDDDPDEEEESPEGEALIKPSSHLRGRPRMNIWTRWLLRRLIIATVVMGFAFCVVPVLLLYRNYEKGRAREAIEKAEQEAEERPLRAKRAKAGKEIEVELKKMGYKPTPILQKNERLEQTDPIDARTNSMSRSYPVRLKAKKQYAIHLIGTDPKELGFDPQVCLRNPDNTVRWDEDNSAPHVYSRIIYFSEREEDLSIVVSSKGFPTGLPGSFRLTVHVKE